MNCPNCGRPIRDPAGYEELLACLAAKKESEDREAQGRAR